MKIYLISRKCKHCKQRFKRWVQWHEIREKSFSGYIWCPNCKTKRWVGFGDRGQI